MVRISYNVTIAGRLKGWKASWESNKESSVL